MFPELVQGAANKVPFQYLAQFIVSRANGVRQNFWRTAKALGQPRSDEIEHLRALIDTKQIHFGQQDGHVRRIPIQVLQ